MEIDNLKYEKEAYKLGFNLVCGVDEAGRGPIAGPVVAAAIILPKEYKLDGLTDSKKLSEKKRKYFYDILIKEAISYSISVIDQNVIDKINILEATKLAMIEAIDGLNIKPDFILIDAVDLKKINSRSIIKGDVFSISISAASILAKVTRDEIMYKLDKLYPEYEFKKHKGYPTKKHLELINKYGVNKIYRKSYKPVMEVIKRNDKEE